MNTYDLQPTNAMHCVLYARSIIFPCTLNMFAIVEDTFSNTRNLSYCPIVVQLFMQMFRQWCVQQSSGWTVLCPIVTILDKAPSNCPLVGQCCVKQSNVAKFGAFHRIAWYSKSYHIWQFQIFCTPGQRWRWKWRLRWRWWWRWRWYDCSSMQSF